MDGVTLQSIQLQLYTDEDVRNLAVVQVKNASTYDRGLPKANGVNDARMGVTDKALQCPTCGLTSNCNNHYGYIELEKPVIRLGHMASILSILRCVCWACSRPKFKMGQSSTFVDVRAVVSRTIPATKERLRSLSESCKNRFKCPWTDGDHPCGAPQPIYSRVNKVFFGRKFRPKEMELFSCEEEKEYASRRLMPDEIQSIISHIPKDALEILGYTPEISHPKHYIMKAHIVPPPSIRPASAASSTEARMRGENDLTVALQDIVRANNELAVAEKEKYFNAWDKLQIFCSALINQNIKKVLTYSGQSVIHARALSKREIKDIKKRLTGKKGRLRGNLSGKRVDHAGRSVVGPDSSHDIFQLGVPSSIMNTLTFPENVNNLNKQLLGKSILLGANKRNGALTVRMPDAINGEKVLHISLLDYDGRLQLAGSLEAGWTVERHLRDGDWVLFNRQPSLHKASIMAFRAYETKGAQFKLPLPCTKPFNADFDGDEMNLHALQDYTSIAEAQEIMSVPHQMVTPQSNSVIISLVQDSIVGAFMMTRMDSYVDKAEAMQLAMCINYSTEDPEYTTIPYKSRSFVDEASFPKPALLKPERWTGKQIFSWLLPQKLSTQKATSGASISSLDDIMEDKIVIVRRGELLTGRLCKQSIGPTSNGIIQALWKQFSPWSAAKFVSDAQRILMQWLRRDTLCISIRDCITTSEPQVDIITADAMGKVDAIEKTTVPQEIKEVRQTQILQETLRNVGATVLSSMDTNSGIATVVASGSKGNLMNIAQIAGMVGQQTINGARIPFRRGPRGGRTLACFAPNDNTAEARGFVASSYLMGLQPSEFFFHQQAGREGVVATAVSTADTGYNQRRMVKNQESEVISYDLSVRVSSNLVVQLHYGGDDYDGTLAERVRLPCLDKPVEDLFTAKTPAAEKKWLKLAYEKLKDIKNRSRIYNNDPSHEVVMPVNFDRVVSSAMIGSTGSGSSSTDNMLRRLLIGIIRAHGDTHDYDSFSTHEIIFQTRRDWCAMDDPSLQARLCIVLRCNTFELLRWKITKDDEDVIVEAFLRQYRRGIVNPGEGVGAVGSSSIGEPSTQMTLNIFHYSGIAEKNVTLTGLPRFKQIINAVDTYETANMTIALTPIALGDKDAHRYNVRSFAARLVKTSLSQLVESSGVFRETPAHMDLAIKIDDLCQHSSDEQPSKLSKVTEARIKAAAPKTSATKRLSTYIAVYTLDKVATSRRQLSIEDVGHALSNAYGSDGHVSWTHTWSKEWLILVRPPAWGDESMDRTVTEAVHDALLEHAIVNGIDYVKKAVPIQKDTWYIETEGSDLLSLAQLAEVDPLLTTTNNILEVSRILGVEAALCLLQSELHRVLSFDGSYVDPRHTWLLADTVSRSGTINPLNRHKMEELGGSLLQCASFEQTLDVFEHGAAFAKSDTLGGATEKLIVGQPVHVGTGSFGIVSQEERRPMSTFVAPMNLDTDDFNAEKVMPLHVHEEYEKNDRVVVAIDDMHTPPHSLSTEEYTDDMVSPLLPLFVEMRKQAQRRIPVWIQASLHCMQGIPKTMFRNLEKGLEKYNGWLERPREHQITHVEFEMKGVNVLSKIEYLEQSLTKKHSIQSLLQKSTSELGPGSEGWTLLSRAQSWQDITADDLPPSVVPSSVQIRHERNFIKGPWTIRLSRVWSGENNIKAEESQRGGSDTATYEIDIELSKPWDLMEERGSTDIVLAASILDRAIYLVYLCYCT